MNIYKHDIDRILYLLYGDRVDDAFAIDKVLTNRTAKRIGDGYEFKSMKSNVVKYIMRHTMSVCTDKPRCKICELKIFCRHYRKQVEIKNYIGMLTIVDLFCGAGGLSLGFYRKGFKTVFANDIKHCCIETYRLNHPEVSEKRIVNKDISLIKTELSELTEGIDVDVLVGGPPCQGFSCANRQRMIDDPRNTMYKHFVESIEIVKPKFFVMENVYGILKIKQEIIDDLSSLSVKYDVFPVIVDAAEFGVPQYRRRVLFIGNRLGLSSKNIADEFIKTGKNFHHTKLDDALYGMKKLEANKEINTTDKNSKICGSKIDIVNWTMSNDYIRWINKGLTGKLVFNHKARYNNSRDIEIFSRLHPGDKSDDPKIADIMPYHRRNAIFKDKYFRLQGDKPCKTITAHMKYDCNMYIHPRENRGLTPREAARIQSYPDSYFFAGPYTLTYMQIGNSVPPLLAEALVKVLKRYLKKG